MMKTFVVNADGSVAVAEPNSPAHAPASKLSEIREMLADKQFSMEGINRLILEELALLTQQMSESRQGIEFGQNLKNCAARIKSLQALEDLLQTIVQSRHNPLNLDDPQVLFCFKRIVLAFRIATEKALGNQHGLWYKSIMEHFRDEMAVEEENLRRQLAKMTPDEGNCPRAFGEFLASL